jgi:hypothetical protein
MLEKPNLPAFPTMPEWRAMWSNLGIKQVDCDFPRVGSLVARLKAEYVNGDAFTVSLAFGENDVLDFLVAVGNYRFLELPERLFLVPSVQNTLGKLQLDSKTKAPAFEQYDGFELDGALARMLWFGGAYSHRPKSSAEVMDLAIGARTDWIQDRFHEADVFRSHEAWTPFFSDVAWDQSWEVLDKRNRIAHLLFATDTD